MSVIKRFLVEFRHQNSKLTPCHSSRERSDFDSESVSTELLHKEVNTLSFLIETQSRPSGFLSALEERFADIFFLVDSGVTTAEFQQLRVLLTRLVNQLNFSASTYRLGLAQYGQDIKDEFLFLFSTYQTKEQLLSAIKRLRQRTLKPNEPRNLGKALNYVYTKLFNGDARSQIDQGYRQYLVVLSGKDSDDPIYKEARLLKSAGITVMAFSLGASTQELKLVANPQYIYQTMSNAVPSLKVAFERQEEVATLTDGETILFYFHH